MPQDIRIVSPADFVRLDASGDVDLERTRMILTQIAIACAASGIQHIVLDMRGAQKRLQFREIERVVTELGDLGMDRSYKFAVIQRPGEYDRASFLAACGEEHGWQISTFMNFEDAFDWMNETPASNE